MAYKTVAHLGFPPIDDVSLTQKVGVGFIAPIWDLTSTPPQGPIGGEAIYLKAGGAGIVVGSICELDPGAGAVLAPATGGVGPMCISFNIVPSGSYAWFGIEGLIPVKAPNTVVVGAAVFMLAATPGSVDDAQVNGAQVLNAEFATLTGVPSTGLALVNINRPFHQGQIV